MRRRRWPIDFVLSVLLIGLVAVLAALQYKWLGQASEADREQMRRSITERARQFTTEFDREIAAASSLLRITEPITDQNAGKALAVRMERWRAFARFPEMVRDVYAVSMEAGAPALSRYSSERQAFEPVGWPEGLEAVRIRLQQRNDSHTRDEAAFVPLTTTQIVPEVPAVLIAPAASAPSYTLLVLDGEVLRQTVLPALARQHFPEEGTDPYRLVVTNQSGQLVYTSGDHASDIRPENADASASLLQLRPETLPEAAMVSVNFMERRRSPETAPVRMVARVGRVGSSGPSPVSAAAILQTFQLRGGAWTLLLQHPSGSIDAAIASGRRRNLWVSFGILTVLAAGMGLVVANARRSERLAAQQMDFVSTVSHELRTPVAAMRAAAQNLSAGVVPDRERIRLYGQLIETEGKRLTDMVEQVLEFAGLSGNVRELAAGPVNPAQLVEEAVESCRPLAIAAGCTIEVDISNDSRPLPPLAGDGDALRRAVTNLIVNAVKYGADGQWIGVAVRSATLRGGNGEIQILVSDRGQGVDPVDLPRLFEPFYRGRRAIDRQIQGSGLGLSLVRRIAETHGGRVVVRSTPGEGATFTLHLPA